MRNDANAFMSKMEDMLNADIINRIVRQIYRSYNLSIIRQQLDAKIRLIVSLKKFFNVLYYDNNFIVYMNTNNDVVMENTHTVNMSTYLYSSTAPENTSIERNEALETIANTASNTQNNLLQTAVFDGEETNDVVLFNSSSNQYVDNQGFTVQKKINFQIIYI